MFWKMRCEGEALQAAIVRTQNVFRITTSSETDAAPSPPLPIVSIRGNGRLVRARVTDNGDGTWSSTDSICRPHCEWDENNVTLVGECKSLGANTKQMENYDPYLSADWTYTCRVGEQCLCTDNALPDPTCSIFGNPNHGITNFDSLPWAIVSLFQAISLEGWVDMMYQLMDGVSSWHVPRRSN